MKLIYSIHPRQLYLRVQDAREKVAATCTLTIHVEPKTVISIQVQIKPTKAARCSMKAARDGRAAPAKCLSLTSF
jgi:hypothetical protein